VGGRLGRAGLPERRRSDRAHLHWPPHKVQAALNYAAAFEAEIDAAIADAETVTPRDLFRQLPHARSVHVAAVGETGAAD